MTTRVIVHAPADHPVEIKTFSTLDGKSVSAVMEPGTTQEFHPHATIELHVRELPTPPEPEPIVGDSDLTQTTPGA